MNIDMPEGYQKLLPIIQEVLEQMTSTKGETRHGRGDRFEDQITPWIISRGYDYPTGQAIKKLDEAKGMVDRGEKEAAREEVKGAICYLVLKALFDVNLI